MGMRVRGISVGMPGIWMEMQKSGNQGGDAGNQGGNLSIVIEIIWNNNGNDNSKI